VSYLINHTMDSNNAINPTNIEEKGKTIMMGGNQVSQQTQITSGRDHKVVQVRSITGFDSMGVDAASMPPPCDPSRLLYAAVEDVKRVYSEAGDDAVVAYTPVRGQSLPNPSEWIAETFPVKIMRVRKSFNPL